MIYDFLQLCSQDQYVNDIAFCFDTRPESRRDEWLIDLKLGLRFKIKDLGNGDILFDRPQFLYNQNGELKGKDFKTIVDAPVYNINTIGHRELFEKFQDFIRLSIAEEYPYELQQILGKMAQESLNRNYNNVRGQG